MLKDDALDNSISNCSIPHTNVKPLIMKNILKRWQYLWDQEINRKLMGKKHSLLGEIFCSSGQNYKERVVLTRCRIDCGRFTQLFIK